jgi:hypothetical protein
MKRLFLSLLVLLALCWTVVTVVTALVRGEGHGAVFITSLCVLGLLCVGLLMLLRRVWRPDR